MSSGPGAACSPRMREITRALDADLIAAHGLPLSSYEVLLFLAGLQRVGCGCPSWPTASC